MAGPISHIIRPMQNMSLREGKSKVTLPLIQLPLARMISFLSFKEKAVFAQTCKAADSAYKTAQAFQGNDSMVNCYLHDVKYQLPPSFIKHLTRFGPKVTTFYFNGIDAYPVDLQKILALNNYLTNITKLVLNTGSLYYDRIGPIVTTWHSIHELELTLPTNTEFRPEEFMLIAKCKNLQKLTIKATAGAQNIDDEVLENLKCILPTLTELKLSGQEKITLKGFQLLANCARLQKLDISETSICGSGLEALQGILPQLVELRLKGCQGIPSDSFALLARCTLLQKLDVSGTHMDGRGLEALQNILPQLIELRIKWCEQIPLDSFACLTKCVLLQTLDAFDTHIGDIAFQNCLPQLIELDLYKCRNVTCKSFQVLACCSQLRILDIRNSGIDVITMEKLESALPACRIRSWW